MSCKAIHVFATVGAVILASACAAPAPANAGPAFSAGQTYHYRGTVRIDPQAATLAAEWTIFVSPEQGDTLSFLLNERLKGLAVSGQDVVAVETGPGQGALGGFTRVDITLARGEGQVREFEVEYSGALFDSPDPEAINIIAPDKIELTVDSFWMPFDARFSERLTAEVEVEAPGDWIAVISTGEARLTPTGAQISNTTPQPDIALTLLSQAREASAAGYRIFDTRRDEHDLSELAGIAAECTAYLDARFGAREPLPMATLVIHDRSESGYSRGTLIALTNVAEKPGPEQHMFICHEFAHFWASNGNPGTVENWLNESFAEYIGVMAVRDARGEAAADALLSRFRAQVETAGDLPAIWTPEATERNAYLVNYRKGPLALAALEARIGRERFAEFMRRAMVERISTTPELLNTLEDVAGGNHRAWFEARLAE